MLDIISATGIQIRTTNWNRIFPCQGTFAASQEATNSSAGVNINCFKEMKTEYGRLYVC